MKNQTNQDQLQSIKVAAIQQKSFANKEESLRHTKSLIEDAAAKGAQLICLQELHATLYFCQTEDTAVFDLAEPIQGPTFQFLSKLASEHGIVIVGSIFEKRAHGLYHNTAIVIEKDGTLAGYYRKMHIPDDPGFYEKFYFTPGDADSGENSGFTPINTSLGKLGVLVCWDQWYPEAARLMALQGAELLIYPTAIGWDPDDSESEQARQRDAWQLVQRGHSVANNLPVIAINRVGHEQDPSGQSKGIEFWGHSFISGQQGEFLTHAANQEETVLLADVEIGRVDQVRRIWPYFRDRRIDAYAGLDKRYLD